jgi:quercetin dioxygenase-like cupin family protein
MDMRCLSRCVGLLVLVLVTIPLVSSAERAKNAGKPPNPVTDAMPITLQKFEQVQVQECPWGWIRWLINAQVDPDAEMTFGVVYIKPQQTNPLHVHPNSAEYLHVLEGSCEHRVGDQWVTVKVGDTLRIPQGVKHMARTKAEPCRAVIVYNTGKREMVVVTE